MPGIATLNNGNSQVVSMSCTASGDCAAAGTYQRQGNRIFVAGESGGTWGNAEQLPGMATLNKGNVFLRVNQVSCGKPGNCVAGGAYTDAAGHGQAWLAAETGGIWHAAHAVAGLAALNQGGAATVLAVSCPARTSGECTAAGYYNTAGQADQLGFVISQQSGRRYLADRAGGAGHGSAEHREQRHHVLGVVCTGWNVRTGWRLPAHHDRHQHPRAGVRRQPELTGCPQPLVTVARCRGGAWLPCRALPR